MLLGRAMFASHGVIGALAGALSRCDQRIVHEEAERILLISAAQHWTNGWQPAEVIRQAGRLDGESAPIWLAAIAADHSVRAPATLHPRWSEQLAALDLPTVAGLRGWLRGALARYDQRSALMALVSALRLCSHLGPVAKTMPPPGATHQHETDLPAQGISDAILTKVRALLAQAESTTFEAEAETFTAKAQELMARFAIDAALLWSRDAQTERPNNKRIDIDEPYANAKATLLHMVAVHSRCRSVFTPRYGLATIVGFAADLAATELLFTSLLVQSQAAMLAESAGAQPGAQTRSRGFRSSFLDAYAYRVGQRLAATRSAVEADVDDGSGDLLPVLAARQSAVDDVVDELFGKLGTRRRRGAGDPLGWSRGRLAADRADLGSGHLRGSSPDALSA